MQLSAAPKRKHAGQGITHIIDITLCYIVLFVCYYNVLHDYILYDIRYDKGDSQQTYRAVIDTP